MAATDTIHNSATAGFADAASYDTHRPSYPPEALEKLLQGVKLAGDQHSGTRVIDLAAGTGKLTELLAKRPERYEILAVEPHDKMRKILEAKSLNRVRVISGTAEHMTVEDGWADLVVIAQAFHWFANEEALGEIHRVLKPGGKLAMIWNADDYNKPHAWTATTVWEQKLNELVIKHATDGQPRFRDLQWRDVFERQNNLFGIPLGEDQTEWTVKLAKEGAWDRLSTLSHIALLQGEEKTRFREAFDGILDGADGEWNERSEVTMHGKTVVYWTDRLLR